MINLRRVWALPIAAALVVLTDHCVSAQNELYPLPRTNRNGDYVQKTSHGFWTVVDPDPAGLNCRWSPQMPDNWFAPDAKWPILDIWRWPIVHTFKYGSVLTANRTPAGFITFSDTRDLPWIKVALGFDGNDTICLVRAHRRFIVPIHPQ